MQKIQFLPNFLHSMHEIETEPVYPIGKEELEHKLFS